MSETARVLFTKAMRLLDAAGVTSSDWTFGGGTVLMLRHHHHRVSKDIDIFLDDPQWLGYFNPEISDAAEEIADFAIVDRRFLKLYCPEGEIDFIVAGGIELAASLVRCYREKLASLPGAMFRNTPSNTPNHISCYLAVCSEWIFYSKCSRWKAREDYFNRLKRMM